MFKKWLLFGLIFCLFIYFSCGGGSGGGSNEIKANIKNFEIPNDIKGIGKAGAEEKNLDIVLPELKNAQTDNYSIFIVDEDIETDDTSEVTGDNYTYTYSKNGILVKIPIPEEAKQKISIKDTLDNNTIDETEALEKVQTEINKNKPPYVLGLDKTIPVPFCTIDKTMCLLFDLKNLKEDITVAVVPYETMLGVPNNGEDAINKGYMPLPEYSADIAVYSSYGKRYSLKELENIFKGDNTTVTIYLTIPYEEDLKDKFKENSNYKLYLIKKDDNNTPYYEEVEGNLKVVQYEKDNVTLKAIVEGAHGFYPFVLARKIPGAKVREIKGTNPELKNMPVVVEACPEDSELNELKDCSVISVGKVLDNGSYSIKYEKPENKKVVAKVISKYIEKPVATEINDNGSLDDVANKITLKETYPSFEELSDNDKLFLKFLIYNIASLFYEYKDEKIFNNYNGFYEENLNLVKENYKYLIKPNKLGDLLYGFDKNLSNEISLNIINFIHNTAKDNNNTQKRLKNGKCSYFSEIKNGDFLKFGLNCNSLKAVDINTTYSGNIEIKITKDKEIKNKFNILATGKANIQLYGTESIEVISQESWNLFPNTNSFENHKKLFNIYYRNNNGEVANISGGLSIFKKGDKYILALKTSNSAQYSTKCSIKWEQIISTELRNNLTLTSLPDITAKIDKISLKPGNGMETLIKDSDIFNVVIKRKDNINDGYAYDGIEIGNRIWIDKYYLVNKYKLTIPHEIDENLFKKLFCTQKNK